MFRALERVRRIERKLAQWAEWQAEHAPPPALVEATEHPAPAPAEPPRSIEDRFWEFFERVNPHLLRPAHFEIYVRKVLRAVGGELRLIFSAPPQHGKTEVTLALIAFLVLEHPGKRWAYVTYNQTRANSVARNFKRILSRAGKIAAGTLAQMALPGGGQILFTSVEGGITGEPIDGSCFIDDPYKNRKEADSQARRQLVDETYRSAIEIRVHPGASLFLLATRWHPEDLSGTLADEGWECINLRAIAEGAVNDNGVVSDDPLGRKVGEPLFPALWPADALAKKRAKVLEFTWDALYQGRPRKKGGKLFRGVHFYTKLPEQFSGGYGIDLAYSEKTANDHSVCVELLKEERRGADPLYYVVWADIKQVEAPEFAITLRARHVKRPAFRMVWRASGTEKGSAQFLIEKDLPIDVVPIPGDKIAAAQHVAPAWNAGQILVPDPEMYPEGSRQREELEAWLWAFVDCLHNFTGVGKEFDDPVDALGNIFDELRGAEDDGGIIVVRRRN